MPRIVAILFSIFVLALFSILPLTVLFAEEHRQRPATVVLICNLVTGFTLPLALIYLLVT